MLHPFPANYIHPFKIVYSFFKYGIQIHYFKDFYWSLHISFWSLYVAAACNFLLLYLEQ
jgi:hypothetical protein